jgi:transposase
MLHRTRQLLVRQRTMLSNALRGHLAELGIVSAWAIMVHGDRYKEPKLLLAA